VQPSSGSDPSFEARAEAASDDPDSLAATVATDPPGTPGRPAGVGETRQQLRGSSLLLVGRLLSVGVNLVTQVLIARYLSVSDFGAFGFALSVVALVGGLLGLGFERAIPRFLPIYDERDDRPRFFGTLALVLGVILGMGAMITLLIIGFQGALIGRVAPDAFTVTVVALMIALAPIEALDTVLTDLFAVFRSARAIFLRKYILAPGLRLLVVTLLIATASGVEFLAVGYVLTGLLGIALYATMLPGLLRRVGLVGERHREDAPGEAARGEDASADARGGRRRRIVIPFREIVSYTVPLLTMDLVLLSMSSIDTIIVGNIHGTEAVAELRVVDSTAKLNALVFTTFSILFVPAAARFFARGDRDSMRDLYWRHAAWIAVLSFPIFALTFSLAEPVTVLLFEERYRSSGIILAILSLARYIDAAFGANGQTIRVFGGVKEIVVINIVTAGANLVLALLLIPPFSALGAAVAILLSYIVYNILKQIALRRVTGIPMFDMTYAPVYGAIVVGAVVIGALEITVDPPLIVELALAGIGSLAVVSFGRRVLHIADTFPELLRFPGGRFLR